MTDTTTAADAPAPTTEWNAALQALRARYPKIRQPILVALHILMQDPAIDLADVKAQGALHGTRITAATVSAAQRLLSRQDDPAAATGSTVTRPPAARVRRVAKADTPLDIEELIRGTVAKVSAKGAVDAERLRTAMRKAIDVLSAAVEA